MRIIFILFFGVLTFNASAKMACGSLQDYYSVGGCTVTATRSYSDSGFGEVDVKIYSRGSDSKAEKIFYLVGPYSENGDEKNSSFYYSMLPEKLKNKIHQAGIDVAVFNFSRRNNDFLQNKANALIESMKQIDSLRQTRSESVMLGVSLGGVVARYALATLEKENYSHGVQTYFSYDAPHKGAYVPPSLQRIPVFLEKASNRAKNDNKQGVFNILARTFLRGLDLLSSIDSGKAGRNRFDVLDDGLKNSSIAEAEAGALFEKNFGHPAAKQLLIHHVSRGIGSDPLRTQLLKELDALGFPKKTKNIAFVNGSISGRKLSMSSLGNYFDYYVDVGKDTELWLKSKFLSNKPKSKEVFDIGPSEEPLGLRAIAEYPEYFYGKLVYPDLSKKLTLRGDTDDYTESLDHSLDINIFLHMNHKRARDTLDEQSQQLVHDATPCSYVNLGDGLEESLKASNDEFFKNISVNQSKICFIPTFSAIAVDEIWANSSLKSVDSPFDLIVADTFNKQHINFHQMSNRGFEVLEESIFSAYQKDNFFAWFVPVTTLLLN